MAFADAGKWLLVSLNEHCWVSWQSNRLPVNLHKNISSIQVCWAPCRPLSNNWQDQHSNPARHEMRPCTSRFIAEHQWQLQSQGKLPWVKAWSLKLYLFRTTFSISCAKIHEELWHWYLGNWMKMPKALTIDSRRLCECRRVYVAYVCVLHVISVQSILKYRIFTCCQGSLAACRSSSTADT